MKDDIGSIVEATNLRRIVIPELKDTIERQRELLREARLYIPDDRKAMDLWMRIDKELG